MDTTLDARQTKGAARFEDTTGAMAFGGAALAVPAQPSGGLLPLAKPAAAAAGSGSGGGAGAASQGQGEEPVLGKRDGLEDARTAAQAAFSTKGDPWEQGRSIP